MIRAVDTMDGWEDMFPGGRFDLSAWQRYASRWFGVDSRIFQDDMEECLRAGAYSYEKDFLPVIQAVYSDPRVEAVRCRFSQVTAGLDERVRARFGKELAVDVVLYLGLCNGAGWAVAAGEAASGGPAKVLLGIEKILELDWTSLQDLQGLVYHELGHLYHSQNGELRQEVPAGPARFVWQLFTEGAAMCFEQMLAGDMEFYHQDKNGWKVWCQEHFLTALRDFDQNLPAMTQADQRYFGDWVRYRGRGDVGYYLGARWVQSLLHRHHFNEIIQLPVEAVCARYREYVQEMLGIKSSLPR